MSAPDRAVPGAAGHPRGGEARPQPFGTAAAGADLAAQARRRARLAALLGHLLLEEPGPGLAELVSGVPALEPLAAAGADLAVEYERLLLREVPPYESVFLSDDGRRGGPVAQEVADLCARHGFSEEARWRVAGPDHLGLELRLYARLCADEAEGWEQDRPDVALRAVEAERGLLVRHLGRWGAVAAEALAAQAGTGPYAALAGAVADFLAEEAERLRPAPEHPGLPGDEPRAPSARLGPDRLAQWLLAPGPSGVWLDARTLGEAALRLGIPWRPSDPRSQLRKVVEEASAGGDLGDLLAALRPAVAAWRDRHRERESAQPGAARHWRAWRLQAEQTLAVIDRVVSSAVGGGEADRGAPVAVTAGDPRTAAEVVRRLRPLGLRVALSVALPPEVAARLAPLLDTGADELLLAGDGASALAWRDGGTAAEREARLLPDVDVVVRVVAADTAAAPVEVAPGGDKVLADRVREVLAGLR